MHSVVHSGNALALCQRQCYTLLATPADPACPPDYLGLPFGMAIPLNVVELPVGTYTVVANGVSTTFEWTPGSP